MTTFLSERSLQESRRPLDASVIDFLRMVDGGVRFHAKEFHTQLDPLGEESSEFFFDFTAGTRYALHAEWSASLELELFRRRIAMDKIPDEALRGGTLLFSAMQYVDLSFGKDYTDAVLRICIEERFGAIQPIRDLIGQVPPRLVNREQLADCHSRLVHMLDGYGNSLMLELGYSSRNAFIAMTGAVYHLFDKRHFISTRRLLFPDW